MRLKKPKKTRYQKYWDVLKTKLPLIASMVEEGMSKAQIARYFDIPYSTFLKLSEELHPEIKEVMTIAKEKKLEHLHSKVYQLAMGIVDTDIVVETTEQVETIDKETGEKIIQTVTHRTSEKKSGKGKPSLAALQTLLKAYEPQTFNSSPVDSTTLQDSPDELIMVDDIPRDNTDIKMFYDDSQDKEGDDE